MGEARTHRGGGGWGVPAAETNIRPDHTRMICQNRQAEAHDHTSRRATGRPADNGRRAKTRRRAGRPDTRRDGRRASQARESEGERGIWRGRARMMQHTTIRSHISAPTSRQLKSTAKAEITPQNARKCPIDAAKAARGQREERPSGARTRRSAEPQRAADGSRLLSASRPTRH